MDTSFRVLHPRCICVVPVSYLCCTNRFMLNFSEIASWHCTMSVLPRLIVSFSLAAGFCNEHLYLVGNGSKI